MRINILDKNTAEKIAAGEVIENPVSVVKELVENALDAGSTRIEVEISDGGKKFIAVTDNGYGIAASEVPLAFRRYATSKLKAIDDLDKLSSLGFRGEALPSIAAVSRVSMITRPEGSISGTKLVITGGEISKQEEVGAPPGTRVEVHDLFYNTPGRLKFLRSNAAETMRISTLLSEMALAYPSIAFSLTSNKKKLFKSTGDGVSIHTIGLVYGNETAEAMLEISGNSEPAGYSLCGFISAPHLTRSTRRWITLVVNGRLVKNPMILNALERGYGDYLPMRRHPLAVVQIDVPTDAIDVNVHPAKVEIRFQDPDVVQSQVYRAVKAAIHNIQQAAGWPHNTAVRDSDSNYVSQLINSRNESLFNNQAIPLDHFFNQIRDPEPEMEDIKPSTEINSASSYRVIGQYLQSYLVVQQGNDLLLIDQHAAHERIIYQQLVTNKNLLELEQESQLTIPVTVDFPVSWRCKVSDLIPALKQAGFDLEMIGENSFVFRAVPFVLHGKSNETSLNDLVEDLFLALDGVTRDYKEIIFKTIACHRAVKAKQALSREEMEKLLADWLAAERAHFCPHGRPTVINFKHKQIERSFHRKGG